MYSAQPWSNATIDHRALCILLRNKIIIKSFGPNFLTLETTAYRKGSDEYSLPKILNTAGSERQQVEEREPCNQTLQDRFSSLPANLETREVESGRLN